MSNVYLGCPLYDGTIQFGTGMALWNSSRVHAVRVASYELSLVARNSSVHWCTALNLRQELGLTWFAMLHSDVAPEAWWLDKLIAEAEKHQADLLSAVVPIKSDLGLTSTAILKRGGRSASSTDFPQPRCCTHRSRTRLELTKQPTRWRCFLTNCRRRRFPERHFSSIAAA